MPFIARQVRTGLSTELVVMHVFHFSGWDLVRDVKRFFSSSKVLPPDQSSWEGMDKAALAK